MESAKRILLFFVLPLIAPLLYPPENWTNPQALPALIIVAALFLALGYLLYRGYSLALTLSIFIQGLNVIIRLMMIFPHAVDPVAGFDWMEILAALASIALSFYLLLRLDRVDVRVAMVR
jgi:hypothetical protein